jgi:hypothetical protein
MADEKKTSGSDTLGIIFKKPKPKPDESATSPMTELYGRSLSSISDPNKRDIRAFNLENAFSETTLEEGTIVSDRRKDRPGFFENVGSAFSEWQKKTFGPLRKTSADGTGKKEFSAKGRGKESEAILPASKTNRTTPRLEKMRVMQHDLDAQTATPNVSKKDAVSGLQKIRTFKSDSALLQGTPEKKKPIQITPEPKAELVTPPKKERVPEPQPEIKVPIKKNPEPPLLKKDARLAPSVHTSMVAPEVSTRLQTDAASFIPGGKKEDVREKDIVEKERVRTYVAHIPDTVPRTPTESSTKKIEPMSAPQTAHAEEAVTAQWTHTVEDTNVENVPVSEIVAPQPLPKATPRPPVKAEVALRESATPILPDEIRSIESEKLLRETVPEQVPRATPANLPIVPNIANTEVVSESVIPVKQPREAIPEETPTVEVNARGSLMQGTEARFHGDETVRAATGETKMPLSPTVRSASLSHSNQRSATSHSLQFSIRMILALIGVGTLIVLGALYFTQEKTPLTTSVDPLVPQGPSTSSTMPSAPPQDSGNIMLSENPQVFLSAIMRAVAEAPTGLTYLEVYTGEPLRDATAQEFFGHLQTTFMPRAVRALHPKFIIGSITTTQNEPFMVIRSDNFDTLFAGLLAWESSMQQELAPLFGSPQPEEKAFADAVRNNKSIRILRDSNDTEVLLYSFINERTVIITASSDALSQLIGHF